MAEESEKVLSAKPKKNGKEVPGYLKGTKSTTARFSVVGADETDSLNATIQDTRALVKKSNAWARLVFMALSVYKIYRIVKEVTAKEVISALFISTALATVKNKNKIRDNTRRLRSIQPPVVADLKSLHASQIVNESHFVKISSSSSLEKEVELNLNIFSYFQDEELLSFISTMRPVIVGPHGVLEYAGEPCPPLIVLGGRGQAESRSDCSVNERDPQCYFVSCGVAAVYRAGYKFCAISESEYLDGLEESKEAGNETEELDAEEKQSAGRNREARAFNYLCEKHANNADVVFVGAGGVINTNLLLFKERICPLTIKNALMAENTPLIVFVGRRSQFVKCSGISTLLSRLWREQVTQTPTACIGVFQVGSSCDKGWSGLPVSSPPTSSNRHPGGDQLEDIYSCFQLHSTPQTTNANALKTTLAIDQALSIAATPAQASAWRSITDFIRKTRVEEIFAIYSRPTVNKNTSLGPRPSDFDQPPLLSTQALQRFSTFCAIDTPVIDLLLYGYQEDTVASYLTKCDTMEKIAHYYADTLFSQSDMDGATPDTNVKVPASCAPRYFIGGESIILNNLKATSAVYILRGVIRVMIPFPLQLVATVCRLYECAEAVTRQKCGGSAAAQESQSCTISSLLGVDHSNAANVVVGLGGCKDKRLNKGNTILTNYYTALDCLLYYSLSALNAVLTQHGTNSSLIYVLFLRSFLEFEKKYIETGLASEQIVAFLFGEFEKGRKTESKVSKEAVAAYLSGLNFEESHLRSTGNSGGAKVSSSPTSPIRDFGGEYYISFCFNVDTEVTGPLLINFPQMILGHSSSLRAYAITDVDAVEFYREPVITALLHTPPNYLGNLIYCANVAMLQHFVYWYIFSFSPISVRGTIPPSAATNSSTLLVARQLLFHTATMAANNPQSSSTAAAQPLGVNWILPTVSGEQLLHGFAHSNLLRHSNPSRSGGDGRRFSSERVGNALDSGTYVTPISTKNSTNMIYRYLCEELHFAIVNGINARFNRCTLALTPSGGIKILPTASALICTSKRVEKRPFSLSNMVGNLGGYGITGLSESNFLSVRSDNNPDDIFIIIRGDLRESSVDDNDKNLNSPSPTKSKNNKFPDISNEIDTTAIISDLTKRASSSIPCTAPLQALSLPVTQQRRILAGGGLSIYPPLQWAYYGGYNGRVRLLFDENSDRNIAAFMATVPGEKGKDNSGGRFRSSPDSQEGIDDVKRRTVGGRINSGDIYYLKLRRKDIVQALAKVHSFIEEIIAYYITGETNKVSQQDIIEQVELYQMQQTRMLSAFNAGLQKITVQEQHGAAGDKGKSLRDGPLVPPVPVPPPVARPRLLLQLATKLAEFENSGQQPHLVPLSVSAASPVTAQTVSITTSRRTRALSPASSKRQSTLSKGCPPWSPPQILPNQGENGQRSVLGSFISKNVVFERGSQEVVELRQGVDKNQENGSKEGQGSQGNSFKYFKPEYKLNPVDPVGDLVDEQIIPRFSPRLKPISAQWKVERKGRQIDASVAKKTRLQEKGSHINVLTGDDLYRHLTDEDAMLADLPISVRLTERTKTSKDIANRLYGDGESCGATQGAERTGVFTNGEMWELRRDHVPQESPYSHEHMAKAQLEALQTRKDPSYYGEIIAAETRRRERIEEVPAASHPPAAVIGTARGRCVSASNPTNQLSANDGRQINTQIQPSIYSASQEMVLPYKPADNIQRGCVDKHNTVTKVSRQARHSASNKTLLSQRGNNRLLVPATDFKNFCERSVENAHSFSLVEKKAFSEPRGLPARLVQCSVTSARAHPIKKDSYVIDKNKEQVVVDTKKIKKVLHSERNQLRN